MNKAILVDDEIFFRQGFKSLVDWNECGFEVIGEASNGEDALRLISKLNPDLVITDIRMPVIDGIGLIQHISTLKSNPPKFIIISGYDDFKYAQQAVKYGVHDFVLKPVDKEEIEETLKVLSSLIEKEKVLQQKMKEAAAKKVIENLVFSQEEKRDVIEEFVLLFGPENHAQFQYVIAEINMIPNTNNQVISDIKHQLSDKMTKVIKDVCDLRGNVWVQEVNEYSLGIIITSAFLTRFQMNIKKLIQWVKFELKKSLHHEVIFYIGQAVNDINLLNMSYKTALMAGNYKYAIEHNGTIEYSEVRDMPLHLTEFEDHIYKNLIEQMEEETEASVLRTLDEIFHRLPSLQLTRRAVCASVSRFVQSVLKLVKQLDGDVATIESVEDLLNIQNLSLTSEQLKELLVKFIRESRRVILTLMRQASKGEVYKIKQYIDTHFHENISLKTLAANFYMNPVYLGQLFKKNYGVYFKEYLLKIRIEEAKKLLRKPDLKIYEIADAVGFNNHDYFVTIFGRIVNITPSEYRNKSLKERMEKL